MKIQCEFLLPSAFVVLCVRRSCGTTGPAKRGIAFLGAMLSEPKDQPLSELAAILTAGLLRETLERLRAMAKQYATRDAAERKARPLQRPIAGTKLIREYQGIEHCVTVRADDFEYLGRPYKSLSSIAREITGTKWNGLVFFGLKRHPGRT